VDRCTFIVMDSHHLLFAGLPAHPIPAVRRLAREFSGFDPFRSVPE
jgi:hypothetical protein